MNDDKNYASGPCRCAWQRKLQLQLQQALWITSNQLQRIARGKIVVHLLRNTRFRIANNFAYQRQLRQLRLQRQLRQQLHQPIPGIKYI